MPTKAKKYAVKTVKKATQKAKKTSKKAAPVPPLTAAQKQLKPRELAKALLAQKTAAGKWEALYSRAKHIEAVKYNMKMSYGRQTAVVHKTLGWGFILDNKNDRLEVLFKDGIKYLISNYK